MRVCTWNIQLGLKLDAIVHAVRTRPDFKGLDLFCLQEASIHGGRDDAAVITEAMGTGYRHFQATAQLSRGQEQGNALIWRRGAFEPTDPSILSLTNSVLAKMPRVERTLLRAIAPQQRIAIRAESPAMRVYVVHLDVIGFKHKVEQLRAVITDNAARPRVPLTVVAGDLNTFGPPGLQLWRRLAATTADAGLVDVTRKIGRTHWTAQKLDAIFVKSGVFTSRAWTLDVHASDHHAVFADIEIGGS
ncbi:MAG: hypothetical protein NVS9B11_02430 [Candidatus Dormibacteraceae bacterium]